MEFTINTDWNILLEHNYLIHIKDNLKKVENKIYPENEKIFNAFNHFNQKDLDLEKSKLIKLLNYTFGKGKIFERKVKNYTMYATIQTLLNEWRSFYKRQ